MYLNLEDIETIQLDHTSRCNLACPQCARTGKTLLTRDLTLEDYEIILEPFERNKIELFHCGNYGDVIASPTFEETLEYSLDRVRKILISTNGSARKESWWKNLAQIGKDKLKVVFSIDGLKDTNHLYRVGSNYDKIMSNAKAFIDAGGKANWQFIIFEHNQHQVEEAKRLAKEYGFEDFVTKITSRFASKNKVSVVNRKGKIIKDMDNNPNQDSMIDISIKYGSFDNYVNHTSISCKYQQRKELFIDMDMRLWPCCWFGVLNVDGGDPPQVNSFKHVLDLYGKNFNDMRANGWDVLKHPFFEEYLEKSWNQQDDKFRRIYTCGRTCGTDFEFTSGFGKNIIIEKL